MMRGFSSIAKATSLAALMIFVGCSGDDNQRLTEPGPDSGAVLEVPMAPQGPSHRGVSNGDLLRWNAPTNAADADVAGYNVYIFDPQPGSNESYVRLNGTLVSAGRLVVSSFTPGETMYFRVAAVSSNDEEGSWSEPTSFVAVGPEGDDGRGGLVQHDGLEEPDNGDPYQP